MYSKPLLSDSWHSNERAPFVRTTSFIECHTQYYSNVWETIVSSYFSIMCTHTHTHSQGITLPHHPCYICVLSVNLFIANILRSRSLYIVNAVFINCLSCWLLVRVLDATKNGNNDNSLGMRHASLNNKNNKRKKTQQHHTTEQNKTKQNKIPNKKSAHDFRTKLRFKQVNRKGFW